MIKSVGVSLCGAIAAFLSSTASAVDVSDMAGLAAAIAGNDDITLMTDIDCAGWTTAASYSGTIDGQNHAIKNLTVAFINAVGEGAAFENLVIKDAVWTWTKDEIRDYGDHVGGLAISMTGANIVLRNITFSGCAMKAWATTSSTVSNARAYYGMIAGSFSGSGTFEDVKADNTCTYDISTANILAGGFFGTLVVGRDSAVVEMTRCVMAAVSSHSGSGTVKEFAGFAYSANVTADTWNKHAILRLTDCENSSSLNVATGNSGAAGFFYNLESSKGDIYFTHCANRGSFTFTGTDIQGYGWCYLGGFIGCNKSSGELFFEDCINTGDMICTHGVNKGALVMMPGGFIGRSVPTGAVADIRFVGCANTGAITGYDAGGFVGEIGRDKDGVKHTFTSCLQLGALTNVIDGFAPGQFVGYLYSVKMYAGISVLGSVCSGDRMIGSLVFGASLAEGEPVTDANIDILASEGLVSGSDVAALNAYGNCNLWKQGTRTPILRIMPDEPAPDGIEIIFKDTETYGGTVFKTAYVARGGWVYPPTESPEHEGVTFLGWGTNGTVVTTFDNLTDDTAFVALYQQGTVELTVRFFDWDGMQIGEDQTVVYGEAAVAPADPVREGYLFTGWDKDFSVVMEDLDVSAEYIARNISIETGEEFKEVLSSAKYPDVTYHLANDITLSSGYSAIADFIAGFDGDGHVIHMTQKFPLFMRPAGRVGNFILDGDNGGNPTVISTGNAKFALVADDVLGGEIHDVVVRNYTITAGENFDVGFIAARLCDGGVIRRCVTDSSCTFNVKKTQNAGVGGIVGGLYKSDAFGPMDEGGNPIIGAELARVESSTNNATICYYQSNAPANIGGIVGVASGPSDTVFQFTLTISNCVNNGDFILTSTTGPATGSVTVGGILGYRATLGNNLLSLVDCVNTGDIAPISTSEGSYIGGIVGSFGNSPHTVFRRNVNRGKIGAESFPSGAACTAGHFGGLVGYFNDFNSKFYTYEFVDSANYGDILGGAIRGGLFGTAKPNGGGGGVNCFVNCANYGDGWQGSVLGSMVTVMSSGKYKLYVTNCFFRVTGPEVGSVVAQTNPQNVITDFYGNFTPGDDGYTLKKAVSQLNEYAEANGYEPWVKGKVGDLGAYPELGIFCEKLALSGLLMLFR